jgi:hypothetical protein
MNLRRRFECVTLWCGIAPVAVVCWIYIVVLLLVGAVSCIYNPKLDSSLRMRQ